MSFLACLFVFKYESYFRISAKSASGWNVPGYELLDHGLLLLVEPAFSGKLLRSITCAVDASRQSARAILDWIIRLG